jgi:hypothetical protein
MSNEENKGMLGKHFPNILYLLVHSVMESRLANDVRMLGSYAQLGGKKIKHSSNYHEGEIPISLA